MRRFILTCNIIAPVAFIVLTFAEHFWWGLFFFFAAHALWLIATLVPNCAWFGEVIMSFKTQQKEVWLTIDDGPDENETLALLDLLDAHKAKATFFFIGTKAEKLSALVSEVRRRGCEAANHTQHHAAGVFWSFGTQRIMQEVRACSKILQPFTRKKIRWFRAPAGLRNHCLHPVLEREGLRLVGWSARGYDGVRCDPAVALARIKRHVKPGAIILIHEGRGTAVELLRALLIWLDEEGYACVLPDTESLR